MVKSSCGQKGKTIDDAVVIWEQEGGLYKLKGHPEQALFHEATLLKVFQKFKKNMMGSAKDV